VQRLDVFHYVSYNYSTEKGGPVAGETSLAAWLDAAEGAQPDDTETPARRRRFALLGLVAVPWIVVALLMARLLGDVHVSQPAPGAGPVRVPAAATAEVATAQAPAPTPTAAAPVPAVGDASVRQAARAALTMVSEGSGRIVEDVVVEAIEPAGAYLVARVRAVVIDVVEGTSTGARLARFAVPMQMAAGVAHAAGGHWPLPTAEVATPVWRDAGDPALTAAAVSAAEHAGYGAPSSASVARSDTVPGVVALTMKAVAPGAQRSQRHVLWLADGPAMRLLGAPSTVPEEVAS
jgi:hypothetical protein